MPVSAVIHATSSLCTYSHPVRKHAPFVVANLEQGQWRCLKYLYRRERLDFTTGMLSREEDYTIEGPVTHSAILELIRAGKEPELEELYRNWD